MKMGCWTAAGAWRRSSGLGSPSTSLLVSPDAMAWTHVCIQPCRWMGAWITAWIRKIQQCKPCDATPLPTVTPQRSRFETLLESVCSQHQQESNHSFLAIAYSRRVLGQTGDGHFSPVAAYHRGKRMALVLDVARFKYPSYWLHVDRLYAAMMGVDMATCRPRGYVHLTKRVGIQGKPLLSFVYARMDACEEDMCRCSDGDSSGSGNGRGLCGTGADQEAQWSAEQLHCSMCTVKADMHSLPAWLHKLARPGNTVDDCIRTLLTDGTPSMICCIRDSKAFLAAPAPMDVVEDPSSDGGGTPSSSHLERAKRTLMEEVRRLPLYERVQGLPVVSSLRQEPPPPPPPETDLVLVVLFLLALAEYLRVDAASSSTVTRSSSTELAPEPTWRDSLRTALLSTAAPSLFALPSETLYLRQEVCYLAMQVESLLSTE